MKLLIVQSKGFIKKRAVIRIDCSLLFCCIRIYKFLVNKIEPQRRNAAMQHTKEYVKHREHKDAQRTQRHFYSTPLCSPCPRKRLCVFAFQNVYLLKGRVAFFLRIKFKVAAGCLTIADYIQ